MRYAKVSDPVYAPNSKGGPQADTARYGEPAGWHTDGDMVHAAYTLHAEDDDWGQAGTLVREVMDDAARDRLVGNVVGHLLNGVTEPVLQRAFEYWRNVDKDLGTAGREGASAPGSPDSRSPTCTRGLACKARGIPLLSKYPGGHGAAEPLSATRKRLAHLMRIVGVSPRYLDSDLVQGAGLTASEYTTIMHLSEAPDRELRMADLANATDLSASRMTRLVDDLQSRGLVTKTASSSDAHGNVAKLALRGMAKLKATWPVHLRERAASLPRLHGCCGG